MTTRGWRAALAALGVFAVGSCASGSDDAAHEAPPRAQNDVCAIFDERPGWREAMLASSARWGTPIDVKMAIIWRESSFRARARPPRVAANGAILAGYASSAYGYSQAIDGTWDWYRRESGNRRADRTDFTDAADFVGWYMAKTRSSLGLSTADAYGHYLAYHEGHTGYRSGRWRAKDWLRGAAGQVARQAKRYREQLRRC
ncbi:MAG: transglycosylase SLT domain-containing protein [Paracoccaceae bacterium]